MSQKLHSFPKERWDNKTRYGQYPEQTIHTLFKLIIKFNESIKDPRTLTTDHSDLIHLWGVFLDKIVEFWTIPTHLKSNMRYIPKNSLFSVDFWLNALSRTTLAIQATAMNKLLPITLKICGFNRPTLCHTIHATLKFYRVWDVNWSPISCCYLWNFLNISVALHPENDVIFHITFRGFKRMGLEFDICQTKLWNQVFSFQLKA